MTENWDDAVNQMREAIATNNREKVLAICNEIMGCCGYDSAENAMRDLMACM